MKTYTLPDKCTVEQAGEIREQLLKPLSNGGRLRVDMGRVAEADMSLYLLLLSARRTYEARGKELVLEGALPGALAEEARWMGLEAAPQPAAERS
jgi:anti-anti-sigma regulatory factor